MQVIQGPRRIADNKAVEGVHHGFAMFGTLCECLCCYYYFSTYYTVELHDDLRQTRELPGRIGL